MAIGLKRHSRLLTVREMCIFAVLGSLMFASKIIMELLPNIHLLGMLIMVYTVTFGIKALFPVYIFVFLQGVYGGFAVWWIPYLYIWDVLVFFTLLIPKKIPDKIAVFVYPLVCALHGILYGVLYAPVQALVYGFDFEQTLVWISAGLPFDVMHAISNFFTGFLVLPFSKILKKVILNGVR